VLNNLSDEAFLALRHAAALPVIYAQLLSMNNIQHLADLLKHRTHEIAEASKPKEEEGTFNFSGL
jgi:hypothetical protein